MRNGFGLVFLAVLATGCHARFKREVGALGDVKTQVITTSGPYVQLGMVSDESIVGFVVNTVQAVKAIEPQERIANAVDITSANAAFQKGFSETIGDGPPFGTTDDPGHALMQVELTSWGLYVPYMGAPGVFTYDFRVQIFRADGKKVYKTNYGCATDAGNPPIEAQIFGTVNNVKQLREMPDSDIQAAFDSVAEWCGGQLVARVRRHAG